MTQFENKVAEVATLQGYREAFREGIAVGASEATRWHDLQVELPPKGELLIVTNGKNAVLTEINSEAAALSWWADGWTGWRAVGILEGVK